MTIDEINIPQATSSEFKLVCKRTGKSFALAGEMLIGQAEDCTIAIKALKIRRYHAKLSKTEDGLFLEDLNAQNNTYLNGCRIGTGAWVTLGDEINFDGVKFLIQAQGHTSNASHSESTTKVKNQEISITQFNNIRPHNGVRPHALPELPFSNQDVLEATRALEARAKERLQLYKKEEARLNPDWETFIAKRHPNQSTLPPSQKTALNAKVSTEKNTAIKTTATPENTANSENLAVTKKVDTQNNSKAQSPSQKSVVISELTLPTLDAANDIDINQEADEKQKATDKKNQKSPLPETPSTQTTRISTASTLATHNNARLIVQTAPTRGKYYLLAATDAKQVWTIGRAKKADIQLREGSIDLIHAHIELIEEGYKIRTTRTTNGMLVNGKLKNEALLTQGDNIRFGRVTFKFQVDTKAPEPVEETSGTKINLGILAGTLIVLSALLIALTQNPL